MFNNLLINNLIALSDSFKYLCYGLTVTANINIFTLTVQGSTKVGSRAVTVEQSWGITLNIFKMLPTFFVTTGA